MASISADIRKMNWDRTGKKEEELIRKGDSVDKDPSSACGGFGGVLGSSRASMGVAISQAENIVRFKKLS